MLDKQSLAELADIYKEKYNRLLKDNAELEMQIDEANVEVERLRKERDEARQIACNREAELNRMMFDNPKYSDSAAIAAQRGWDCFKENTDV